MDKDLDEKLKDLASADPLEALAAKAVKAEKKQKAKADVPSTDLTEEEKASLSAEAETEIALELKAERIKEFKAVEKARLKKQALFQAGKDDEGDDLELVFIQLAQHMPFIKLDNNVYYPNRSYRLNKKTCGGSKRANVPR